MPQIPMRHISKDDPGTWVRFRKGLCEGCFAACCTMPVEMRWPDIVRLGWALADDNQRIIAKQLIKQGLIGRYRDATGVFTMARRSDGACALLDADRRCLRYDDRPQTCRDFPKISSRPDYCPAAPKTPTPSTRS